MKIDGEKRLDGAVRFDEGRSSVSVPGVRPEPTGS